MKEMCEAIERQGMGETPADGGELLGDDRRLAGRDADLVETAVHRPIGNENDRDDDQQREDAVRPPGGLPFVSQLSSLGATRAEYTSGGPTMGMTRGHSSSSALTSPFSLSLGITWSAISFAASSPMRGPAFARNFERASDSVRPMYSSFFSATRRKAR